MTKIKQQKIRFLTGSMYPKELILSRVLYEGDFYHDKKI